MFVIIALKILQTWLQNFTSAVDMLVPCIHKETLGSIKFREFPLAGWLLVCEGFSFMELHQEDRIYFKM